MPEVLRADVEDLVAELVEWRVVRYGHTLTASSSTDISTARLKVARNTGGRPILFLRRDEDPVLPNGRSMSPSTVKTTWPGS